MSSCLARVIFCALSRSTPASSTRLGHIRVFGRNNPCLEHPRQMVVSSHTRSSMACITITEGRRDIPRAVWMEKVANTPDCAVAEAGSYLMYFRGYPMALSEGAARRFNHQRSAGPHGARLLQG